MSQPNLCSNRSCSCACRSCICAAVCKMDARCSRRARAPLDRLGLDDDVGTSTWNGCARSGGAPCNAMLGVGGSSTWKAVRVEMSSAPACAARWYDTARCDGAGGRVIVGRELSRSEAEALGAEAVPGAAATGAAAPGRIGRFGRVGRAVTEPDG